MPFTSVNVVMLRQKHPDWTLEKIGKKCGVSKQRVHAILAKAGAKTALFFIALTYRTSLYTSFIYIHCVDVFAVCISMY